MKNLICLICICTFILNEGISQPTLTFQRQLVAPEGQELVSFQSTPGGYLLIGNHGPFNQEDIFISRIDYQGKLESTLLLGEPDLDESANALVPTSDNGFMLLGRKKMNNYSSKILLTKLDSMGTPQWSRLYGELISNDQYKPESIIETKDEGFLIIGSYDEYSSLPSNALIIKTDKNGIVQWSKVFGGAGSDKALFITVLGDGNYVVAGKSRSFQTKESEPIFMMKIDEFGVPFWFHIYDGEPSMYSSRIQGILGTYDEGILIYGGHMKNQMLLKTDEFGNLVWSKSFNTGSLFPFDVAESSKDVIQIDNGGFLILGQNSGLYNDPLQFIHIESNGDFVSAKIFGKNDVSISNMVSISDKEVFMAGTISGNSSSEKEVILFQSDLLGQNCSLDYTDITPAFSDISLETLSLSISMTTFPILYETDYLVPFREANWQDSTWCDCQSPVSDFTIDEENSSYTFTPLQQNNQNFLWDFGDGNFSDEISPIHTYSIAGSYEVCCTASNYCSSNTTCFTIDSIVTNALSPNFYDQITLYPNPTSGILKIKQELLDDAILYIFDSKGRVVKKTKLKVKEIDLNDLPPGLYFVKIENNNRSVSRKIIKI